MRSDEAGFGFRGGVLALARASASSLRVLGVGSVGLSAATVFGLLSSLEFFSVLGFLERKTSLSRLVDDCLESDWSGVRPV